MSDVFQMAPASGKTLWILGGILLLLVGLVFLFSYITYASQHVRFEVSSGGLSISGPYGRTIPAEALVLDQAGRVDLARGSEYQPRLRTNGIGLPGYQVGWFKLHSGDKALLFVTDTTSVVHIPTTEGYGVLLSVDRPDAFLESLSARMSGG